MKSWQNACFIYGYLHCNEVHNLPEVISWLISKVDRVYTAFHQHFGSDVTSASFVFN